MLRLFATILLASVLTLSLRAADAPSPVHRPRIPAEKTAGTPIRKQQCRTEAQPLASRGLLILAEFSDVRFVSGNAHHAFDSLANSTGYRYNNAPGSAREYFRDQSGGQYVPQFDVVGPVTLPHPMAYYGKDTIAEGYDRYLADFIIDACLAAKDSADWTRYDNDNDGIIDFVFVLYAGYGQADSGIEETLWPCNWDVLSTLYSGLTNRTDYYAYYDNTGNLRYNLPVIGGKILNEYACANEWNYLTRQRGGIGTFVHEFSHVLGLPDYYTTGALGRQTPGTWSLMAAGNYNDQGRTPPAYSTHDRYFLGWTTPTLLNTPQQVNLPADGSTCYMVTRNGMQPQQGARTNDTIYYIENRPCEGWDTYLPGNGMLIWRVVYDDEAWQSGLPNDQSLRYSVVSASGRNAYTANTLGGARQDVPFPGSEDVTAISLFPDAHLQDITQHADGSITFSFQTQATPTAQPATAEDGNIRDTRCYNILGQEVDPATYHGIVVQGGKKYILW